MAKPKQWTRGCGEFIINIRPAIDLVGRKPRNKAETRHAVFIDAPTMIGLRPADCRGLAVWLLNAADWMEGQ